MKFTMIDHFKRMDVYNRKANRNLYSACSVLPDEEISIQRPGFTTSLFGMLSHIYIGDTIWMTRFSGEEIASTGLYDPPCSTFDELRTARVEMDDRISSFVQNLDESFLSGTIRYKNNRGHIHEDPVDMLITHLFNHQTYHRAQVNSMLKQTGTEVAVLDMHRVLRPDPVE